MIRRVAMLLLLCLSDRVCGREMLEAAETGAPVEVAFQAKLDGTEQRYVLVAPPGVVAKPVDLLIVLHGHGRDRWQFVKETFPAAVAVREFASAHGMLLVSPDYRHATSWMGPAAEADLLQIIEDLKSQYSIHKIYLCGGSMGGTSALTFAAMHPELINGVAAMNPLANHFEYGNYQDAIQASFGGTKAQVPAEYKKRSSEYWPEKLTMPIAVTTGGQDKAVPPESVTRLMNVLKILERPVLQIHRPQGGHSTTRQDALDILGFMLNPQSGPETNPAPVP